MLRQWKLLALLLCFSPSWSQFISTGSGFTRPRLLPAQTLSQRYPFAVPQVIAHQPSSFQVVPLQEAIYIDHLPQQHVAFQIPNTHQPGILGHQGLQQFANQPGVIAHPIVIAQPPQSQSSQPIVVPVILPQQQPQPQPAPVTPGPVAPHLPIYVAMENPQSVPAPQQPGGEKPPQTVHNTVHVQLPSGERASQTSGQEASVRVTPAPRPGIENPLERVLLRHQAVSEAGRLFLQEKLLLLRFGDSMSEATGTTNFFLCPLLLGDATSLRPATVPESAVLECLQPATCRILEEKGSTICKCVPGSCNVIHSLTRLCPLIHFPFAPGKSPTVDALTAPSEPFGLTSIGSSLASLSSGQLSRLTPQQILHLLSDMLAGRSPLSSHGSTQSGSLPSQLSALLQQQPSELSQQGTTFLLLQLLKNLLPQHHAALTSALTSAMNPQPSVVFPSPPTSWTNSLLPGTLFPQQSLSLTPEQLLGMSPQQLALLTPQQLAGLTPQQLALLTPQQLAGLTPQQLSGLSPQQLAGLTPQQLAVISPQQVTSAGWNPQVPFPQVPASLLPQQFLGLTPQHLAVLPPQQLAVLPPQQLAMLTPQQLAGLTPQQLASLTPQQLSSLSPQQLAGLTPQQLAAISPQQTTTPPPHIPALPSWLSQSHLAALSPLQIAALNPLLPLWMQLQGSLGMTPEQLAALAPNEIGQLKPSQLSTLSPQQLASLTPEQLYGLTPVQLASLTPQQISALSPEQLSALIQGPSPVTLPQQSTPTPTEYTTATPSGMTSQLPTTQPTSDTTTKAPTLTPEQIANLTTEEIGELTPDQILGITPDQITDLSPEQLLGLTPYQIGLLPLPVVEALPPAIFGLWSPEQLAGMNPLQMSTLSQPQLQAIPPEELSSLSPDHLAGLSPEQIANLTLLQLADLTPEQLADWDLAQLLGLRPAQISSLAPEQIEGLTQTQCEGLTIPQFQALTPQQCAQLSPTQLQGLTPQHLTHLTVPQLQTLTAQQLGELSVTQVSGLSPGHLAALSPVQLGGLKPAQLAGLSPLQLQGLSPEQLGALTIDQLKGLTLELLGSLTLNQLSGFTPEQLAGLTLEQLGELTPLQVAALTPFQLSLLSPEQRAILESQQLPTLTPQQLTALTPQQVGELTPLQLAGLTPEQLGSLTPEQFGGFSPLQLGSLSLLQLSGLTPQLVAALTPEQLGGLKPFQCGGLTKPQLQGLTPLTLGQLTPEQFAGFKPCQLELLSLPQIAALTPQLLASLSPFQLSGLTPAQIGSLSPLQLGSLTQDQLGGLNLPQFRGLTPLQLGSLTPLQFGGLRRKHCAGFTFGQFSGLKPQQCGELSLRQLSGLSPHHLGRCSLPQLNALRPVQLGSLWPRQMFGLRPRQCGALSRLQLGGLTPTQCGGLFPQQLMELSPLQLGSLTPLQLGGLKPQAASCLSPTQLSGLSPLQLGIVQPLQSAGMVPDFPEVVVAAGQSCREIDQLSCEFTNGICSGWLQHQWLWRNGVTVPVGKGPGADRFDDTTGQFAWVHRKGERFRGRKFPLKTPVIRSAEALELRVHYFHRAAQSGNVMIYLINTRTRQWQFVKTVSSPLSPGKWFLYRQPLPLLRHPFRVALAAKMRSGASYVDIAVDGISVVPQRCAAQVQVNTPVPDLSNSPDPDGALVPPTDPENSGGVATCKVPELDAISCEFTTGVCEGWLPNQWQWKNGATLAAGQGPSTDREGSSTGHFAWIYRKGEVYRGRRFNLMTPIINYDEALELRVHYFPRAAQSGNVMIYLFNTVTRVFTFVKTVSSPLSPGQWFLHRQPLPAMRAPYRVVLAAKMRATANYFDLAVDGISLVPLRCSAQIPVPTSVSDLSLTANPDGPETPPPDTGDTLDMVTGDPDLGALTSAEPPTPPPLSCSSTPIPALSCTFDGDSCGWTLNLWEMKTGETMRSGNSPSADRLGSTSAGFLYFSISGERFRDREFRILSPEFSAPDGIEFTAHFFAPETESVQVLVYVKDMKTLKLTLLKTSPPLSTDVWFPWTFSVPASPNPLQLILAATMRSQVDFIALAVDDMSSKPAGCV